MDKRILVIFDLDGTLFQTHLVTVPAVQQAFANFGLIPPEDTAVRSFFGKPQEDYEQWLAQSCLGCKQEVIDLANALELRYIRERGSLYSGTVETLQNLTEKGYVLALCSNGPESYVHEVVTSHQLGPFFHLICAQSNEMFPDKFVMTNYVLETLKPTTFAVIGDRKEDMLAARHFGGFAIAATYGYGAPEEWESSDARITSIMESPTALEDLFSYRQP